MRKRTGLGTVFDCFNVIILITLSFISLYPFLYVIFASLSDSAELALYRGMLFRPLGFSTAAYKAVFEEREIITGFLNTIIYVVAGTAINVIMTSLGAFVLSRKNFYWNKLLMPMAVFTMFFGGGLIPNFLLIKALGMYDTRWAILIPTAISTWNLFIMKTNFMAIPASLEESAEIDGANSFIVFIKIVMPLSMPVIAVMILYYGVGNWNSWFNAMVYLKERDLFPLQLFLREFLIANSTEEMMLSMDVGTADIQRVSETVKYATIVVATLPILCVYPFLQKYFVKGVMIGAIKG